MLKRTARHQQGFTLTELLIVVIILAILAAIVVPQFASSSDDAKVSALQANLARLRSAIDLYYQQHGVYPGAAESQNGPACPGGGTQGGGAANSEQAFIDQLTRYTNAAGNSCTTTDAAFKFGPYLKKDTMPDNPITALNAVKMETTGALGMIGEATDGGWRFDVVTGQFIANDQDYDHL